MSEKSERIDLNSDVVLNEPESEAVSETSRLSGKDDVVLGGSSVEEEEQASEVRVLEAEKSKECLESGAKDGDKVKDNGVEMEEVNVDESKEKKMEDLSLKEGIEDKGTVSESSRGCVGKVLDLSDCVNEAPLSATEAGPDVASDKGDGLVGDENGKEVSSEGEKGKEDFAEVERSACDTSDKTVSPASNLGVKLDERSHLQSREALSDCVNEAPLSATEAGLEMASDKGDDLVGDENGKEASSEAEKGKEDFAEVERSAGDGSDKTVSLASNSGVKLNERSHSQSCEVLPCVSQVLEPKLVESAEPSKELTEDVSVIEEEMKINADESLNNRDSKVSSDSETVPSDGLQNGALEVHLQEEPKRSGNGSNSIDIVIDLNPKKGSDKGASRDVKVKSASKPSFNFGDLVWGKVRSHPWWPGQICDPSAASKKAKKYFKRDAYLIAYYGDNTFAWNEVSRVKPFLEHFSQMEKQSNTEDFHYAIDCALEEVSRRVEFGLACPCLSEEVYVQIESQIIVNAGVQEELSRREGGDGSLTADSFKPAKLVEYIKELAQDPNDGANDKLEFAVAQSELLAFCRWKGYSQLPEFNMLGGILENDADIVLSSENKHFSEANLNAGKENKDNDSVAERAKTKMQKCSSLKRKLDSKDNTYPSKKEKSMSDLMVEKSPKTPISGNGSESKATKKKRKASGALSNDLPVKQTKSMPKETENKTLQTRPSFRVGDSIRRVASQLNGSSPILKNGNGGRKRSQPQTKSKEEIQSNESEAEKEVETENSSGLPSSDDDERSLEDMFGGKTRKRSTKNGKKSNKLGGTELPHQRGSTDESYWSERIGRSIPEDQDETGEFPLGMGKKENPGNPAPHSDSKKEISDEDLEIEAENPEHESTNSQDDPSPTALILNFSDLDSIPSETSLNKIFSQYGSLNESQTEIFKKSSRAKVVFRKRSDAETAFSSAGKYSTFGPSLVSYRLKYQSSLPSKASPKSKRRSKTDKASEEDNKK